MLISIVFLIIFIPIIAGLIFKSYINNCFKLISLFIAIGSVCFFLVKSPKLTKKQFIMYMLVAVAVAVLAHLFIAHALYSTNYAWDAGVVQRLSEQYIKYGTTEINPPAWEAFYLAKYANNISITLVLVSSFSFFGLFGLTDLNLISQILNSGAIIGAFMLMIFSAHRIFGRRAAILSYMAGVPLIIVSAFTPITYTDTLGMFFVSLIVVLIILFKEQYEKKTLNKKAFVACAFFLGVALAAGYLIKPTVAIIFIALGIVIVSRIVSQTTICNKRMLIASALFMLGLIITASSYNLLLGSLPNFAKYSEETIDRYRAPAQHYLGMGSLRGLEPWTMCESGGYCSKYVDWIQGENGIHNIKDRKQYSLNLWFTSVKTDFPFGYGKFLVKKMLISYSDGSFGVWREGGALNSSIHFFNGDDLDLKIRDYLGPAGENRRIFKSIQNTIWLAILILIVLAGFVFKDRKAPFATWMYVFRLTLIGLSLYLMLFECRARYLFLYLPVFILLAVGSAQLISKKVLKKL